MSSLIAEQRRYKVLHIIPSVSERHGGPTYAMRSIVEASHCAGIEVLVATTDDDGNEARLDVPIGKPVECNGITYFFFGRQPNFYKVSLPLRSWISSHAVGYDLLHVHALFSYPSTSAARIALSRWVPYIVRHWAFLISGE
jgi:hypothetical protein